MIEKDQKIIRAWPVVGHVDCVDSFESWHLRLAMTTPKSRNIKRASTTDAASNRRATARSTSLNRSKADGR
jgi:hypothetical protein